MGGEKRGKMRGLGKSIALGCAYGHFEISLIITGLEP